MQHLPNKGHRNHSLLTTPLCDLNPGLFYTRPTYVYMCNQIHRHNKEVRCSTYQTKASKITIYWLCYCVVHTCWHSQWTSAKPSNAATVLVVFEKTKNAAHVKIASGKWCRGRVWFPCGNEDEVSAALNVRMSCCTLDMISWCLLKHRHTLTCEVKPGQWHIPTVSRSYHHNAFMYLCQCFPSIKTL